MSATWELIKRHRGKIITGGIIIGGAVAYVIQANENNSKSSSWAQPIFENDELKSQARKHYVFDTNHRSCDQSIVDLIPSIKQLLQARFDVDSLVRKIQTEQLTSAEKIETWQRVKITSFSRLISQAYSYSILTVTLKAQISILAAEICAQFEPNKSKGSSWLPKSLTSWFSTPSISKASESIDNGSRQIFLQCIQFFTTKGICFLFDLIEEAVTEELSDVSLKDKVDKQTMRLFLQRVESKIESTFNKAVIEMVAPITAQDGDPSDGIYRLLRRLITVLESPWCLATVSSLVDFYFAAACHRLPDEPTPLATILPAFADSFEFVSSNAFDSPLQNSLCCSDVHSYANRVFKMPR